MLSTKDKNRNFLLTVFGLIAFIFITSITLVDAQRFVGDPSQRLTVALNDFCISLVGVLPVLAILLFVLAAVAYGVGHIFGAEMRSRATSWATTMVVGAVISLLIFVLTRPILTIFVPEIATSDFCAIPE